MDRIYVPGGSLTQADLDQLRQRALIESVKAAKERAGSGYGGGGGEWVPIGKIQTFDEAASIAGARDAATRQANDMRRREIMAVVGKRFSDAPPFPMNQVFSWAERACAISEAYGRDDHADIFLEMLHARFRTERDACLQSIQEAKEATDFIISGKVS